MASEWQSLAIQVRVSLIIALEVREMKATREVGTQICRSHLYAQPFQEGLIHRSCAYM